MKGTDKGTGCLLHHTNIGGKAMVEYSVHACIVLGETTICGSVSRSAFSAATPEANQGLLDQGKKDFLLDCYDAQQERLAFACWARSNKFHQKRCMFSASQAARGSYSAAITM
eukprot:1157826-Pelagomonas_calceolata.AAC.4